MGDNARDRPGGESVFGGKQGASRSESAGVRLVRTRSLESQFHGLAHDSCVDHRFTCQEASLAAVVVVGGRPAEIQGRSATDHGRESVVAKTVAAGNWGVSQRPATTPFFPARFVPAESAPGGTADGCLLFG